MPTYPFSSIISHKIWLRYMKKIKVFKIIRLYKLQQKIALNELKEIMDGNHTQGNILNQDSLVIMKVIGCLPGLALIQEEFNIPVLF